MEGTIVHGEKIAPKIKLNVGITGGWGMKGKKLSEKGVRGGGGAYMGGYNCSW